MLKAKPTNGCKGTNLIHNNMQYLKIKNAIEWMPLVCSIMLAKFAICAKYMMMFLLPVVLHYNDTFLQMALTCKKALQFFCVQLVLQNIRLLWYNQQEEAVTAFCRYPRPAASPVVQYPRRTYPDIRISDIRYPPDTGIRGYLLNPDWRLKYYIRIANDRNKINLLSDECRRAVNYLVIV